MNKGLTYLEMKTFKDLLIKANLEQCIKMSEEANNEVSKRFENE